MTNINDNKIIILDKKDKKLLHLLDFNARLPVSRLAKEIGMSKQGTEYRLNSLQKIGVIKGFYPVINVPKLGYLYCRLSLTLKNIDDEIESQILSYLKKDDRFFWIFTTQGIFDFLIVMWARSITEFKTAIDDLYSAFGHYIKSKNESITTDVIHYQSRFLNEASETREIHMKETSERVSIDDLDKKILRILCDDARTPLIRIARQCHVSSKVISYRMKKMEKENLIECYRSIIDHNLLGFTYYKLWITLQHESQQNLNSLYSHLKRNPIVLYIVKGIGFPEDLDIEIMVKNNLELFRFIKDLRNHFPGMIGDYRTFMFIDTIKVRYLPF